MATLCGYINIPMNKRKFVFVFDKRIFNKDEIISNDFTFGRSYLVTSDPIEFSGMFFYEIEDFNSTFSSRENLDHLNQGTFYGKIGITKDGKWVQDSPF